MISDSPYESAELVLTPWQGIAAAAGGGVLMLLLLQLLALVTAPSLADLLRQIGALVAPAGAAADVRLAAGALLHLVVAMVLGLLYALSQRLIPDRGLIGVGLLFGFVTWVVGSVILGRLLPGPLEAALRSWPWLAAHLVFGLALGTVAVAQARRRRTQKRPLVRD